jgi:hypothetical protein
MMFNDVKATSRDHYANPIEPSGSGGRKIAKAVLGWLQMGKSRSGSRVTTD